MRKVILLGALALVLAAPVQAGGWKELRVRGIVVSASAEVVAVENAEGDATLKCLVPERLAEKAAAFKPGDEVRMICARQKGRKAVLVRLERLGAESKRHDDDETSEKSEPREEHERAEATARGSVVELGENAIVVQDAESGRRLACRVPAAKAHKLEGVRLGDRVKILCANGELAYLERAVAEELKLYGKISALSATSVTVSGEERTLTCSVLGALAERLGRFAVGDRVKMMCRGSELTYLEKV